MIYDQPSSAAAGHGAHVTAPGCALMYVCKTDTLGNVTNMRRFWSERERG